MTQMQIQRVIAGHSRSKNGVASLAYDPAIHQVKLFLERWMGGSSPRMTRRGFVIALAILSVFAVSGVAMAQIYPPGGVGAQPVIPYPTAPAAPPPPPITVPAVPRMNSPPPFALQNTTPGYVTQDRPPKQVLKRERRPSFSDRVARCLDDGAAWGMNPNQRAAYSRSCANQ